GHAPLGTRILGVVARRNGDLAVIQLDQNFVIDDELQFAFRALRGDRLAVDRSGHAGGHLYGLLTNTRHVSVLVLLLFRRPIRRSGTAPRRRHSAHAPDGQPSRPWESTGSRCRGRWPRTG